MELSPEDALRLNVMLANRPLAIRIDESKMKVHALNERGEMEIALNPTGRDEPYIKKIKELLSLHVLGTPSGYPTHIQRWVRMGQLRNENMRDLLLLGEPEAVVAVVYSQDLDDELARLAWWAMEDAENARQMLRHPAVVSGQMGKVLAQYLLDYLPFETETEAMMESVRLMLQKDLIAKEQVLDLWRRARRKNVFYLGFLATRPDDLPETVAPHPLFEQVQGNGLLVQALRRSLSAQGQAWLQTLKTVLSKPVNQDVVNQALEITADYFKPLRSEPIDATLEELEQEAEAWLQQGEAAELIAQNSEFAPLLKSMRVLSGSGYGVVRPVFSKTDAIGTLMRKKLAPVMQPYFEYIEALIKR